MLPYCLNCSALVAGYDDLFKDPICPKCYRDPATNNCTECNKHLEGISYPYVCGDCLLDRKTCNFGCGAPAEPDGVCRTCRGYDYGRDL